SDRLRTLMEAVAFAPGTRDAILARQADIWRRFTSAQVAGRFWRAVADRAQRGAAAPQPLRRSKAKIAVMTLLPPHPSGVADYSEPWLKDLGRLTEVHVFTETAAPRVASAYASVAPLAAFPYLSRQFDRVISVMGNSPFHFRIFDLLMRFGGACIAHD